MSELVLKLCDVTKSYPAPEGGELRVLHGISLELEAGRSLAVIGPSGSGKSTLLHLMGALDRPTAGTVEIGGKNPAELDEDTLARLRGREIGFVFQRHLLLPQCTLLENVLVPAAAENGRVAAADVEHARVLLRRVGLAERLHHRPGQLSGGECQRAAVARALVNRPRLLLADEPTGSLDHDTARQVIALLAQLNREERVALVVVTHAPDLAARMERVLRLEGGALRSPGAA